MKEVSSADEFECGAIQSLDSLTIFSVLLDNWTEALAINYVLFKDVYVHA